MIEKLAVKRLTASDLTFFEWHFKNHNAGNQKAINLNANVFKNQLYPAIDAVARDSNDRIGVDLWIGGPDGADPINLQRKIIKGRTYKNWRLDGEYVHDPEAEPERFRILAPHDIAVLGFEGTLAPKTIMIVCLARAADSDEAVVYELERLLSGRSMVRLEVEQLRSACDVASIPRTHPLWRLITDEDLVEAAAGVWPAVARVLSWVRQGQAPNVSMAELKKGRAIAEETGRLGEQLVAQYLDDLRDTGQVEDYEWTAELNAVSPFDFRVRREGAWEKWEIKTTSGDFGRDYYLPRSELREMAYGGGPYRIGRVYHAGSGRVLMRVSENLEGFGRSILQGCGTLPDGVALNGVTIKPNGELFGEAVALELSSGDFKVND